MGKSFLLNLLLFLSCVDPHVYKRSGYIPRNYKFEALCDPSIDESQVTVQLPPAKPEVTAAREKEMENFEVKVKRFADEKPLEDISPFILPRYHLVAFAFEDSH